MAVTNLPLTNKISQSSTKAIEKNILVAKFGDGYEQRTPNGLNYVRQKWSIQWENISLTDLQTIESAIATTRYGADAFLWTPFTESTQKKFLYDAHDVQFLSGDLATVNMTITQVFDL